MMKLRAVFAATLITPVLPCGAHAQEFWRCHFVYGSGTWQIASSTILGPPDDLRPESPRYAVVKRERGIVVAISEIDQQGHFKLVTLDTGTGGIKVRSLGPENALPEPLSENGSCTRAAGMAGTTRR